MQQCTKMIIKFVLPFLLTYSIATYSQPTALEKEDSICKFGEKYIEPIKIEINFPSVINADKYKIKVIKTAIPKSFNVIRDTTNDSIGLVENSRQLLYQYYFKMPIHDYNPKNDSYFTPKINTLKYKLKDMYVFDINGDGKLDLIHYPMYYRNVSTGNFNDIFLKEGKSYKVIHFTGFITDIKFNNDKSIDSIETYVGPCCDDNHAFFYSYKFDRNKNDILLVKTIEILICQLTKRR